MARIRITAAQALKLGIKARKAKPVPRGPSPLEERLYRLLWAVVPPSSIAREYRFHPKRKWLFDFAFPMHNLAIEVEGGIWTGGRHTRGKGFEADCEKYLEAALLGWTVLRLTAKQINERNVWRIKERWGL